MFVDHNGPQSYCRRLKISQAVLLSSSQGVCRVLASKLCHRPSLAQESKKYMSRIDIRHFYHRVSANS